MVQVITVQDEGDGGPAAETIRFCLDAASYEIDLSARNAAQLRELLSRYVTRARPAVTPTPRRGTPDSVWEVSSTARIRAWAVSNGHQVSRVGRLPLEVEHAYAQAVHADTRTCGACAPAGVDSPPPPGQGGHHGGESRAREAGRAPHRIPDSTSSQVVHPSHLSGSTKEQR